MENFGKAEPLGTAWQRTQLAGKPKGKATGPILQGLHLEAGFQSQYPKGMGHEVNGHKLL